MNKLIVIASLTLIGCSHNVVTPNTAACKPEAKKEQVAAGQDNFDKAGKYGALAGRWVWNETIQVYEWITNEQNQKSYRKVWESTKENIKKIFNSIEK